MRTFLRKYVNYNLLLKIVTIAGIVLIAILVNLLTLILLISDDPPEEAIYGRFIFGAVTFLAGGFNIGLLAGKRWQLASICAPD